MPYTLLLFKYKSGSFQELVDAPILSDMELYIPVSNINLYLVGLLLLPVLELLPATTDLNVG